jgi:hypothetical protein
MRLVPEEARVAYRILKNAGFVPPEIDARREIAGLSRLLHAATDDAERGRAAARLAVLASKLEAEERALPASYRGALLRRLDR